MGLLQRVKHAFADRQELETLLALSTLMSTEAYMRAEGMKVELVDEFLVYPSGSEEQRVLGEQLCGEERVCSATRSLCFYLIAKSRLTRQRAKRVAQRNGLMQDDWDERILDNVFDEWETMQARMG